MKATKLLLLISSFLLVSCWDNRPYVLEKSLSLGGPRQRLVKVLESTDLGRDNEFFSCLSINNMISRDQLGQFLENGATIISQSNLSNIGLKSVDVPIVNYDAQCYYRSIVVADLIKSDLESIIRMNQNDYQSAIQSFKEKKLLNIQESRKRQELYKQEQELYKQKQEQIKLAKEAEEQRKQDLLDNELNNIIMDDNNYSNGKNSNCSFIIRKYDCSFTKYLEANPLIQQWFEDNPQKAEKERIRLQSVD